MVYSYNLFYSLFYCKKKARFCYLCILIQNRKAQHSYKQCRTSKTDDNKGPATNNSIQKLAVLSVSTDTRGEYDKAMHINIFS